MDVADFPIIPHESAGVDCCGCSILRDRGKAIDLVCNEGDAVVGTINAGILADLVSLIPEPAATKGE